jgi:hypothetical protein
LELGEDGGNVGTAANEGEIIRVAKGLDRRALHKGENLVKGKVPEHR